MIRVRRRSTAALALAAAVLLCATSAAARHGHDPGFQGEALPVVFVHGFSGSASQYETQALRWASNGYPKPVTGIDRFFFGFNFEQLDAFIDAVLEETGDAQVFALGHSAGTAVMTGYLNSSPERAARVAKYVGIDGASNETCPGGVDESGAPLVPCMGIWGRGSTERMVGPDHNVYLSEQGHTQSVGSAESFEAQFEFLTGVAPRTTEILPENRHDVTISGRALNFPLNTAMEGATVQLYQVHAKTGERRHPFPEAEVVIDETGNFGPWSVDGTRRYEINVIRQDGEDEREQHFYYEPWTRTNSLLRLNISPIGSSLSDAIREHSGPHAGASIVRQKEWWGNNDVDPDNIDVLDVSVSSPIHGSSTAGRALCALLGRYLPSWCDYASVGDLATPGTAPYAASTIAMIAFDVNADGVTNTDELVNLGPFLSGIDAYMPAPESPPNGVVTFHLDARRESRDQVIHTPNWAMDENHFMTINFRDWTQSPLSYFQCKRKGLCR